MSLSSVFADSFLDGFTMAGILSRPTRSGRATQLLASAPEASDITKAMGQYESTDQHIEDWIRETYGLHAVPEVELNTMLVVLKRKGEERNLSALAHKGEAHGATR